MIAPTPVMPIFPPITPAGELCVHAYYDRAGTPWVRLSCGTNSVVVRASQAIRELAKLLPEDHPMKAMRWCR